MQEVNPKCFYCGRFVGSGEELEEERLYDMWEPREDIVYHVRFKEKRYKGVLDEPSEPFIAPQTPNKQSYD